MNPNDTPKRWQLRPYSNTGRKNQKITPLVPPHCPVFTGFAGFGNRDQNLIKIFGER